MSLIQTINLIPKPQINNSLSQLSLNELYQRYGPMLYVKTSDEQLVLQDISIVELGILKRYLVEVPKEVILPANHQHKWSKILICVTELTEEQLVDLIKNSHPTGMLLKIEQVITTMGSLLVSSDIITSNLDMLKGIFLRLSLAHNNIVSEVYLSKWTNTLYCSDVAGQLLDEYNADKENIARVIDDHKEDLRKQDNLIGIRINDYFRRQKYNIYEAIPTLDAEQLGILESIYEQLTDMSLITHLMEIFLGYSVSSSVFVSFFHGKVNNKIYPPSLEVLTQGLQILFKEEQRKALPESGNNGNSNSNNSNSDITTEEITSDDCFLFPGKLAHYLLPYGVQSPDIVWLLLNYYVGFDISSFDLSHAYITGSVIPAVFLVSPTLPEMDPRDYIDLYYPDRICDLYKIDSKLVMNIFGFNHFLMIKDNLSSGKLNPEKVARLARELITTNFSNYYYGADLDIAVSNKLTTKEFEALAHSYWAIARKRYPNCQMTAEVKPGGGIIYNITGIHRTIQVYQSSLKQIMTHHVGMVRGFVTGNGDQRDFYLSASCLLSVIRKTSINYYYFAGKKSKPRDVINKYARRGWFYTGEIDLTTGIVTPAPQIWIRNWNFKDDYHFRFVYDRFSPTLDKYPIYLKYLRYIDQVIEERIRISGKERKIEDWKFDVVKNCDDL